MHLQASQQPLQSKRATGEPGLPRNTGQGRNLAAGRFDGVSNYPSRRGLPAHGQRDRSTRRPAKPCTLCRPSTHLALLAETLPVERHDVAFHSHQRCAAGCCTHAGRCARLPACLWQPETDRCTGSSQTCRREETTVSLLTFAALLRSSDAPGRRRCVAAGEPAAGGMLPQPLLLLLRAAGGSSRGASSCGPPPPSRPTACPAARRCCLSDGCHHKRPEERGNARAAGKGTSEGRGMMRRACFSGFQARSIQCINDGVFLGRARPGCLGDVAMMSSPVTPVSARCTSSAVNRRCTRTSRA